MYPHRESSPSAIPVARPIASPGGSVPASTILVLESSDAADASLAPILPRCRLHGHPDDRSRRGVHQDRRAPARGHRPGHERDRRGSQRRRPVSRDPGDAVDGVRADPVRRAERRRRGADRVPRGRRRRRHRPTRSTSARSRPGSRRCCCASGGPRTWRRSSRPTGSRWPERAGSWPSTARRAASGRRPSPRTSRSPRPSGGRTGSCSWTSTSSSVGSRRT